MFIVAIGWMYVVLMMSITEASVIAGIMTFLLYGVLPVSIILYLSGSGRRKLRRAEEARRKAASVGTGETEGTEGTGETEGTGKTGGTGETAGTGAPNAAHMSGKQTQPPDDRPAP